MNSVPTIRRFLTGAALAVAAVGAEMLLRASGTPASAAVLLALAGVFVVLFWGAPTSRASLEPAPATPDGGDWVAMASLAVAFSLAIAGAILLDVYEPSTLYWQIYAASLVALVAIPAGVVIVQRVRDAGWGDPTTWFWLLLILAMAAVTRLPGLATLPFGTWYDEAANGLEALRIINEPQYRPVYTDGVNAAGHYLYLIVAAFEFFGVDTQSIRLVSALAGVGTVAAAYFAGRELFGRSTGLALAFLMAVSRWAINFSRLGMYNALTPMFELLAVAFLVRAIRRNHMADYVLAGASIGLGFCFYPAFQLFAAALAIFLVHVAITHWRPARSLWIGLVVMAMSALVVVAPIVEYAVERPDSYFARVQKTSLLADKEPAERLPALAQNLRKHLLMFNVRGDPNGRHNLPGEPMLDPVTAALFVIGAGLCVVRWREPFALFLLAWFVIALMGGVLSLDFEAPQSLRSIAALPAVYLLAAVPLFVLNHEWETQGGRYYPAASAGFIALLLLPAAAYNLDTYFRRQAHDFASWNAFSTPETLTAKYLSELEPGTLSYVISLYDQHPTVRFLAQGARPYRRLETTATLPLVDPVEGDLVLIMDTERRALFEEAVRLYPGANYEEVRPPFGGPVVLYYVRIPAAERARLQGFSGVYSSGGDAATTVTQRDGQIDFVWPDDAPVEPPFSVEWTGTLAADAYGPYQFGLEAPAAARLFLNESPVITIESGGSDSGAVILPRGLHQIRVTADSGAGAVRLLWRTLDRETEVVPEWAVYGPPVANRGLLGKYYANGDWTGRPALEQIEGGFDKYFHIPVLARPYTVEWVGKIGIPESGTYGFGLSSNDESAMLIDAVEVASSAGSGAYGAGSADLTEGLHDITIRFADRSDHTFLKAYWTPPDSAGTRRVIPDAVLYPPQGDYARIAVPRLEALAAAPSTGVPTSVSATLPANAEIVVDGLERPAGIAALPEGAAVALPSEGRVVVVDDAGEIVGELAPGGADFEEPFDVAADRDGNLYVLDAGTGKVSRFDSDLNYLGELPIDAAQVRRARGIGLDGSEALWIANTPGGQLIRHALGAGATVNVSVKQHLAQYGDSQPTDVAVAGSPQGAWTLYAADAGVHKLSGFTEDGMRLWSVAIPVANSIDSPHLAARAGGGVYMTEPESGTVAEMDEGGNVLRRWSLREEGAGEVKPVGIAVDDSGAIWLSDVQGGRVLRFQPRAAGDTAEASRPEGSRYDEAESGGQ